MATKEKKSNKPKLFDVIAEGERWKESRLFEAVTHVYLLHLKNDQAKKSFQRTSAGADAWTVHEALVEKLYAETMTAWGKLTGEYTHFFAWTRDRVATVYESIRKGAKKATDLDKETERMQGLVENLKEQKFMWPSTLLLCVLRVFKENCTSDSQGTTIYESRKARSDSWARNSVLREDLIRRTRTHWATLTGKGEHEFPWNATAVARTYLVVRKHKVDKEINDRQIELEMAQRDVDEFKSARATRTKKEKQANEQG